MPLNREKVQALIEDNGDKPAALKIAHNEMKRLEAGAIKNPDEGRQVTHFTDRLTYTDSDLFQAVEEFAKHVRTNTLERLPEGIEYVVINGIGGSALGPQLVQFAINGPYWNELDRQARHGNPRIYFLDNTDTAGFVDVLNTIDLGKTIVITISKSGGTQETLNNMLAFEQAYAAERKSFGNHAVAVTMQDSRLDKYARENNWLAVFPMAESIGGRTSETNIVGHVPAALAGIDFQRFVDGARHMDSITRQRDFDRNPAYQLAVAWHVAGSGRGDRNMVVVPYADRLILFARYLQQLVMESLGKEKDLSGNVVHQGLTVYGNKGGTDAHAYIQQLNDGRDDFFVTFIEVLRDAQNIIYANNLSMGDYLHAFKDGLVRALTSKGRQVIELTVESLDEYALGMLIALYERAVAVYAELIQINAFHQPGVQAYKTVSNNLQELNITLQKWIETLIDLPSTTTAEDIAVALGRLEYTKEIEGVLSKYAVNRRRIGTVSVSREFRDEKWFFTLS